LIAKYRALIKESTLMTIFDRFNIKVVAGAGLCGAAMALSPEAAAAPLKTGGYACVQDQAGDAAAPAAAGAPGGVCASAPLTDMAGVPVIAPGPVVPVGAPLIALGPPVPAGAPLPLGAPLPVVPAGAPLIALGPVLAGAPVDGIVAAPIIDMAGAKDAPTGPAPAGGPVPGQPALPGPSGG